MTEPDKKIRWKPLESNPEAFNQYLQRLGVIGLEAVELYGFDKDSLLFIPQPHIALVFCFPDFDKAYALMKPIYEQTTNTSNTSNLFFMKQKISNACGTFSLFHSLANKQDSINIGNGPFAQWLKIAEKLPAEERSDSLAKDLLITQAHETCATEGETESSDLVEHHFIAYLNIDGRIIEFDSAQNFPRDCMPTTSETFLFDVGNICTDLAKKLDSISCSAIALIKNA